MGSFANSSRNGSGGSAIVDKGVDFAQYFCTYGFLYHQKEMLCDRVRMDPYFNAIFVNKHHFTGKVVLDVGTGSGILAIWSAQAGARKVYAVEATKMAEHACALVKANNLQDVVEVIEGPEKVDVIISEWMGYFLLRESMFDSVICAGILAMLVYGWHLSGQERGSIKWFWCRFLLFESPIAGGDRFAMLISGRRKQACHADFGFDLAFFSS